jgi:LCP family protein required for cell wall assembly
MKKKLSISEIEKSVDAVVVDSAPGDKTPLKFGKKDKKKKKPQKHKKLYITLGSIAIVLLLLGFFGFKIYKSMSSMFGENAPGLLSLLSSRQLKGESSGRVNILLLGIGDPGHAGEYLSDTIMVISYDVATKQVAMISVPRDLYVNINNTCGSSKINYAHACGEIEKLPGGGPAVTSETISKVLDIPIHYYARVNFTGFKDVIDAVGGVDIEVEKELYDYLYPTDNGGLTTLYIKKGMQHMNGETALKYARSRETTSDFDRAKRQQIVLEAIKEKVTSSDTLLNPTKIISLTSALGNNIKTDFDLSYTQRAIELFKNVDTSKIKNLVFDNSEKGLLKDDSSQYAGYILIPRAGLNNFKQLQIAASNIFADQAVATESARISLQNGTQTAGLATRLSDTLKNTDFNVISVTSADRQNYQATKILDGTNRAKPSTIAALEKFFSVRSEKASTASGIDVIIIVGQDYKE